MNICSSGHAEIAHDNANYDCPICELIAEKDEEIKDLEAQVKKLEAQVENLEERGIE